MTTSAISDLVDINKNPLTSSFLSKASKTQLPPGFVSPSEVVGVDTELSQRQAKAQEDVAKADIEIERAKQQQDVSKQEIDVDARQQQAKALSALPQKQELKEKRDELKNLKFVPDSLTANDLATVFSLINVIGVAIGGGGRGNAVNALAAMDGMAKGYQQGRLDLYKQQATEFDKNFKALQMAVSTLEKEYSEAVEIAKNDSETSRMQRQLALAKSGSPVFKAMENKLGFVKTLETIKQLKTDVDKVEAKLDGIAKMKYETKAKQDEADLRYKREIALKKMEIEAKNQQREVVGISADGKTVVEKDVYGNLYTKPAPIDLTGATKIGAKPTGGLGAGAFLESVIGVKAGDEKTNQKIVDTATGVSQLNHVVNLFRDPEIRTGVLAKLNPLREKLSSLGDDNHEISDAELQSIIDGEISPDAKNAVAQKEALFAAYTAEREIAGGRLLVSVVKQAGGALDPTNYEKSGYINLLNSRENELKKRLRGEKMTDEQIDKVVSALEQSASKQPTSGIPTTTSVANKSVPTEADRERGRSNPTSRENFIRHFGVEP